MKKILWSTLALALVVALVLVGGGWYFADQIRDGAIKVTQSKHPLNLEVADISGDRITLRTTPDTGSADWQEEGIWGLEGRDGYDQVGEIIELKDQSVVRQYVPLTGGLNVGDKVRLDHFAFPGDPLQAHGIPFEEVYYSSTLGSFPAWYIEGSRDIWAIFVHGLGASRGEALRTLPVVTELGLPSLVITYRNDDDVPQNPDGFHWFGLTEWEDLEGAVRYAVEHGAEGTVLIGYSMGGGIVMAFLYQSPLAEKVRAVVLDSPVLDFDAVIDHGVEQRSMPVIGTPVPGPVTWLAKTLSSIRFGIDYERLDYLSRVNELSAPILLFQGDADKKVPVASADALAKARPDIVKYVRKPDIGHVRTWNVLRSEYEGAVRDFLLDIEQ
jgi:pimeloyl-ACP methyl ester carboxylesterase